MATAQYLADLARYLAQRGHQLTVVTGQRAYDHPSRRYSKRELWHGIHIHRLSGTGFGKGAKWKRAVDFASFMLLCAGKVLRLPRHDVIIALTSPPLISLLGAWLARVKGGRFVYWVMDLNPDEAIAAGWLKPDSLSAKGLDRLSQFSLQHAAKVVALDRFMKDRLLAKNISPARITIIPPWSLDETVRFDAAGRERFRAEHGLNGQYVVMYAGNHSPCHPLTSLLEAARRLSDRSDISFCFVGGGSIFPHVQAFAHQHRLENMVTLSYQPIEQLAALLSAADLHIVVMGNPFVGIIHPCKIYNILQVGCPFLYLGPASSHIADILAELGDPSTNHGFEHGNVEGIVNFIAAAAARKRSLADESRKAAPSHFSRQRLLSQLVAEIESVAPNHT